MDGYLEKLEFELIPTIDKFELELIGIVTFC
jgi:hypothetical protein